MNTEIEIWKDIPGYEGLYQCSNFGRIKSLSRWLRCKNGFRKSKEKIMNICKDKIGYCYLDLGKRNKKLVHRLVAITFIDNTENKPCVNHKNGIKFDNMACNLEWVTYSENEKHSYSVLGKDIKGEKSHRHILKNEQVIEIKIRIKNGERNKDICKDYPVIDKTISDIRRGARWSHIKID